MPQVLVRALDSRVLNLLKARARKHGRSLQAEMKSILEQAAATDAAEFRRIAARIRKRLSQRPQTDSAFLIGEDRGR